MEKLIQLQNIDNKLRDLNDLLGDLPSKVDKLNIEESELKESLISKKDRQKQIELENNKIENKILSIDEKVNKLKDQLFLVTNNKQYDSLMNEIDHLKTEKSELETEVLNMLQEKESLDENVESLESNLENITKDLSTRKSKLENAISISADEKLSLENQRSKQLNDIEPTIVSTYEKVLAARGGLAVVNLSGTSCGGCGASVPMQKVAEIRAKVTMHRCDVCGRFLYSEKLSKN